MRLPIALALAALPLAAQAQDSTEARMRDALRQAVTEMRAAQDASAQAQSDLAKANADKTALQSQLDAANAKLADAASKPAPRQEDTGLADRLRAAQAQAAQYQQLSAKLQSSYQSAAEQARAKDDASRTATAQAQARGAQLEVCKTTNTKLIDVSEQILHLYESESFRGLLLRSYEPVLGTAKVKLENLVQDYDDKIQNQAYVPKAAAPAR